MWPEFPPFMLDVLQVVDSLAESPKKCCHMNRTGARSSYSKQEKPDYPVWQTGWSSFVNSDSSQGHRRHSMRELLLHPSDVWMEDRQEQRQRVEAMDNISNL
jgi:hypothetical protein